MFQNIIFFYVRCYFTHIKNKLSAICCYVQSRIYQSAIHAFSQDKSCWEMVLFHVSETWILACIILSILFAMHLAHIFLKRYGENKSSVSFIHVCFNVIFFHQIQCCQRYLNKTSKEASWHALLSVNVPNVFLILSRCVRV